jgi:hypothetical protein
MEYIKEKIEQNDKEIAYISRLVRRGTLPKSQEVIDYVDALEEDNRHLKECLAEKAVPVDRVKRFDCHISLPSADRDGLD